MARIAVEAVTHRYGEREVLRDVDLHLVEPRIGIVGGNGSGKSTLARLLNGLVIPTEGRVTVDGLDTRSDGGKVRRRVGFVFTDPDAQIVMPTVAEDVAFSLRRSGLGRTEVAERVRRSLERVGLAGHAAHPAHQLSGGQKQLLAITSVLVTAPDVLVCDEPTTLLDARNSRHVTRLLAELPQQVIMVTHHLHLLDGFDRVIVLDEGRVVADGAQDATLDRYRKMIGGQG
jgi:biotin transport system ATP-binding protein